MSSDSRDVDGAIAAARAGAGVLRTRYGGPLTRFAKSGTDFATEADLDAERAIREVIAGSFPDDAFEGEEAGHSGPADAARTWLVDPLCGTLNFAAGTPLACVNVALRHHGVVSAAAVADPFAEEVVWTDGGSAWIRGVDHTDRPLAPSPLSGLVDVDFDRRPEWAAALVSAPDFVARFGTRVSSTTLALAWVATGRRAAYVFGGDVRNVHFAAGIAVCRSAGCVVSDLAADDPETTGNGLVAAADEETHAALLAMVGATPVG